MRFGSLKALFKKWIPEGKTTWLDVWTGSLLANMNQLWVTEAILLLQTYILTRKQKILLLLFWDGQGQFGTQSTCMCTTPGQGSSRKSESSKMYLTDLTQLRHFGSSVFDICILQFLIMLLIPNLIPQRQGQALHQMGVEWLFGRGSLHKYSRHPYQQQKKLN